MKLKTFLAMAAITIFVACGAPYRATDTTPGGPDATQRTFLVQYPNSTNIVWANYDPNVVILNEWELTGWQTMDESDYVVRFEMDNEKYYAWYDSDGTWIGTAYVVNDFSALPYPVSSTVTTLYPGYTITNVNREFHKDKSLYEVVVKKSDDTKIVLLVDSDGNVIRKK